MELHQFKKIKSLNALTNNYVSIAALQQAMNDRAINWHKQMTKKEDAEEYRPEQRGGPQLLVTMLQSQSHPQLVKPNPVPPASTHHLTASYCCHVHSSPNSALMDTYFSSQY